MHQHERLVHFLVPSLLLHFAAQQTTLPALQQLPRWHRLVLIAAHD
jgi:hypothetical protein